MTQIINSIYCKQKKLEKLKDKSNKALNVVASTINRLTSVNEKIDLAISGINETKEKLQSTENDLCKTKARNNKIIDNFKSMID